MKPEPSALTSFCSRIGSPTMIGVRTIAPVSSLVASGRVSRRMKLLLAVVDGHVCHCRSSGFTVWPRLMSDFATSTSTVASCATGAGGGGLLLSEPLAR